MSDQQWALVTGASSGIGEAFARTLAARGRDVVLVARSADVLERLAGELREEHGVAALVLPRDLARPDAAARIAAALEEHRIEVDLLVNNAGIGGLERFDATPPERVTAQVHVNVTAATELIAALLPGMVARGGGAIVNIASLASFYPVPYMAVYSATKHYLLALGLSLREELRGTGVRVLTVCPGAVDTNFPTANGMVYDRERARRFFAPPSLVVDQSLAALDRDRGYVVPDRRNVVWAHLTPRRPRKLIARVVGRAARLIAERMDAERR
jgi:short-subunit dehydrogenase